MSHKYTLKGGEEEEKKPFEERQIIKEGFVSEFSLVAMKKDFANYEKTIKEMDSNAQVHLHTMLNIEQHHPFVKDIPEFDRYTIHMYQEAVAKYKAFAAKREEIKKEREDYKAELEEIQAQIPELTAIVSPYFDKKEEEAKDEGAPTNAEAAAEDIVRYCRVEGCEVKMEGDASYCEAHQPKADNSSGAETNSEGKE